MDVGKKPGPQHLICPLTKQMFVDPVETQYGRVYERKAIEKHLKSYVSILVYLFLLGFIDRTHGDIRVIDGI